MAKATHDKQEGKEMKKYSKEREAISKPIKTLAPNCADDSFADGIGHRRTWWRLQDPDPESFYRFVQMLGKNTIAIV